MSARERPDAPDLAGAEFGADALAQVTGAVLATERDVDQFLHYPIPSLDRVAGGVGPGEVDFVGGFSGNGKTSLLMSLTDAWCAEGRRVYYVGLESPAVNLRVQWACYRCDVSPGDALTGELRRREKEGDLVAAQQRRAIRADLLAQSDEDRAGVYFAEHQWLDEDVVRRVLRDAKSFGADALIVDHVDHLDPGSDGNLYAESVRVVRTLLGGAHHYGLRILAATQFNNEAVKGDRLAKYHPPQEHHVKFGGHKREVATRVFGLYRPLAIAPADPEAHAAAMKAVRAGSADPMTVTEPDTMAVVCMKHRPYGAREGTRTFLGISRGRVTEPTDAVRRAVEQAQHNIRTGGTR